MPANRPNQRHPSSSRRARDTAPASVLQLDPDGPGARLTQPAPDPEAKRLGKGAGAVSKGSIRAESLGDPANRNLAASTPSAAPSRATPPSPRRDPSASTQGAPAARESATALQAGAGARLSSGSAGAAADSLSVANSTPSPLSAKVAAAGLSVPPEVSAIERMTREILAMEDRLVMLREAAASLGDELEQLKIERDAIERALEVQRVLREELAPRGQDALAGMIVEDAEAAMAARRVS